MRNVFLAMGVILAGLSARLADQDTSNPASGQRPPGLEATSASPDRLPASHPVRIIWDYLAPNRTPAADSDRSLSVDFGLQVEGRGGVTWKSQLKEPAPEPTACEAVPALPASQQPLFSYLLVTVPDPLRTHLAQDFDMVVESVVAAATQQGYYYDRNWLPWRLRSESAVKDDAERGRAESRLKHPGLLLFRGPDSTTLAVFLVGETPTAGINRVQFHNALCYVDRLSGSSQPERLRLLGPLYSGSLASLTAILGSPEDWQYLEHYQSASIISGTATSGSAIEQAKLDVRRFYQEQHPNWQSDRRVRIESVPYPDLDVIGWALDRLRARNVAILTEGDTVYGRMAEPVTSAKDGRKQSKRTFDPISYPRDISHVRNAYQEDEALAAQERARSLGTAREQLPLSLKDRQRDGDAVPQFGGSQLPVAQESALLRVADHLKRRSIDVAVVTGTSVYDLLFLSKFLRRACPDVRLLLLDWNLLFIHGADTLDYTGIAVAGSFAPFFHLQGTPPDVHPPPHVFSSQSARGVYEAALRLLNEETPPDQTIRSEAWLSLIGRDDFWPVARLAPGQMRDVAAYPRPARSAWAVHITVQILFFLLALTFLLLPRRIDRLPRWCSDLHPTPDGPATSPERAFYLVATLASLLAAQGAFGFGPAGFTTGMFGPSDVGFWAGLGLPVFTSAALLLAIARLLSMRGWSRLWLLVCLLPSVLVQLGLVVGDSEAVYLRAYRSMGLSSGASPSLPLGILMLILAWWAWSHALRFIVLEDRRQDCPEIEPRLCAITAGIRENQAARFSGLGSYNHPTAASNRGMATQLVVFCLTLLGCWLVVRSFESTAYDRTFSELVALTTALLAGVLCEFWTGWHDLRRFLVAIDLHPIRQALSTLQQVSFWSLLWQSSVRRRNYILQKRSAETAEHLFSLCPAYYPGFETDIAALRSSVSAIADRIDDDLRETRAESDAANSALGAIARGITARLTPIWSQGVSESLDSRQHDNPAWAPRLSPSALAGERAHVVASEFLALRLAAYIRFILLHLRNLFSIVTVTFILSTIAMLCYPFRGDSLFRGLTLTTFLAAAGVTISVFVQMETDSTLSRLTNTREGRLEPVFYLRILSFGALPMLAVLASVFPSLRTFLFSWVQPALAAMH